MNKLIVSFSLSLLMALTSSAALAQGQAQTTTAPQATQPATEVSDGTVEKFAQAQQQVESIRGEYIKRVQQAEDQQQAMGLQQEAQQKMVEVVEKSGMQVQEYNRVAQVALQDKGLQKRIKAAQ